MSRSIRQSNVAAVTRNIRDVSAPQGVRSDRYSGSKVTHRAEFLPWWPEVEKLYRRYARTLEATRDDREILIVKRATHPLFAMPMNENDVRSILRQVPSQFTQGLAAVLVLSGTRKQAAASRRLFRFGTYWRRCIFLHPFPRKDMDLYFKRPPKPSDLQPLIKAGAKIVSKGNGIIVRLDMESLRAFYLGDVLMHELGHHVDPHSVGLRREKFAKWFAEHHVRSLKS